MIRANKYKVKDGLRKDDFLDGGFVLRRDVYVARFSLYDNHKISLTIMIEKEDDGYYLLATSVTDSDNNTYAPFYNRKFNGRNKVADITIKNFNKIMDNFVERGILVKCDECTTDNDGNTKAIRIKYLSDKIEKLRYIDGKSDWIDLRCAEEITIKQGEFKLIPLGIAMELPQGYEAHIVPRSSTFKNFGIIQTNHMGVVDESYCGDGDQWYFPAYALKDTVIHVNDRICQFRIVEHQPTINFNEVETLGNKTRGGIGSTGKR